MTDSIELFDTEVLDFSADMPVVVHFTAEGCAPCQQLDIFLQRFSEAPNARFDLVNVDIDEHPDLCETYDIEEPATVRLYFQRLEVASFTGIKSEKQLQQWLQQHVPSPYHKQFARAETYFAEGNLDAATDILQKILIVEPGEAEAHLLLARFNSFSNPVEAIKYIETATAAGATANQRQPIMQALELNGVQTDQLAEGEAKAYFIKGYEALQEQNFAKALEQFIAALGIDPEWNDKLHHEAIKALFYHLGRNHPITQQWRPVFENSLF
jgi:putative thioredoxin